MSIRIYWHLPSIELLSVALPKTNSVQQVIPIILQYLPQSSFFNDVGPMDPMKWNHLKSLKSCIRQIDHLSTASSNDFEINESGTLFPTPLPEVVAVYDYFKLLSLTKPFDPNYVVIENSVRKGYTYGSVFADIRSSRITYKHNGIDIEIHGRHTWKSGDFDWFVDVTIYDNSKLIYSST